jgi:hypothetical protein
MYRLRNGGAQQYVLTAAALVLLALVVLWLGSPRSMPGTPKDYEACVEQIQATPPSNNEQGVVTMNCSARFAARRKPGGGYTYYDFMQDRKFDIAGPNPTAEERKQIDREYMGFLDAQRREAVSAELAMRQNERLRTDLDNARQPVGPPIMLTPLNPPPKATKHSVDRAKSIPCREASLSCSWARLSTAVKNAFASSKTRP